METTLKRLKHQHDHDHGTGRHSQPRIRPYVYAHKAKKNKKKGIKVHCIIEARRNSIILDYNEKGEFTEYEIANDRHPNHNLLVIYIKEAFQAGTKPLNLLRLSPIFIEDTDHNGLPIKVKLSIDEDGIDEHDGSSTVHPPDSDPEEPDDQ